MTSYAAPQLLADLRARGYREPMYEDNGYILTHDACGHEMYFNDHASPEVVNDETLLHALSCREMR